MLDEFEEQRPLIHGRLLFSGNPLGADGLDSYDAACVTLAMLDEMWTGTDMTVNPKGRKALLEAYGIGYTIADDFAAVAGGVPVENLSGVAADLAAIQAAMKPKPKPAPTE